MNRCYGVTKVKFFAMGVSKKKMDGEDGYQSEGKQVIKSLFNAARYSVQVLQQLHHSHH